VENNFTRWRRDGARRWRRNSVSPSGGFTSPGSTYFTPFHERAHTGQRNLDMPDRGVARKLGHDDDHAAHGRASEYMNLARKHGKIQMGEVIPISVRGAIGGATPWMG
jgi:hypothetical protein